MKFKKILATIGVTALLTGAGLMAAQSASAHDAFLTGSTSCNTADGSATATWILSNDWDTAATVSNSTNTVIPNGTVIPPKTNGTNGTKTFVQTIAAPAAGVSVTASYTATWPDHTVRDIKAVKVTVPSNCTVPPAKDASAAVTITAPSCGVAAVLHLTGTNVTWSGTADGTPGPKTYNSKATATAGHTFPNGDTSKQFNGRLAGPLHYQNTNPHAPCYRPDTDAAASVSVSAPSCTAPAVLTLTGQNVTWTGTENGAVGPLSYDSTATATRGHAFPNGDASKNFTGDLAGPLGYQNTNPDAPCYKAHDDATATVSVTPPTCSLPGTASYLVQNAELVGQLDQTTGSHKATFNAKPGHEFSDGETTVEKSYTVAAATGNCPQPPTKPAASVTKPKLADTGSDVTVGLAAGLIALLGGATGVGIAMFRRRRGNAQA